MRPNFKKKHQTLNEETKENILIQYELERKLADKLRRADKNIRLKLYPEVYDEFFKNLPSQSMILRKKDAVSQAERAKRQASLITPFLKKEHTFMEMGAGDCSLSFEISRYAKKVIAVDVSEEITKCSDMPANFELILIDGVSINIPPGTVNVAFSNQLMEHLHPEDALAQLMSITKCLADNGLYICLTPHRYLGPHDVSKYFHNEAVGFHLKEYTHREIEQLFKKAGFSKIYMVSGIRGRRIVLPIGFAIFVERLIGFLPHEIRKDVASLTPFRKFINAHVLAKK